MKSMIFAALATVGLASSALAAEQTIVCSNAAGFQVNLTVNDAGQLGKLSYGKAGQLTTVDGVETSIVNGVGGAVKGNEVLFTITPEQGQNLGELIVDGTTYQVSCAK